MEEVDLTKDSGKDGQDNQHKSSGSKAGEYKPADSFDKFRVDVYKCFLFNEEKDKFKCKFCNIVLAHNTTTNFNLKKHMKSAHPNRTVSGEPKPSTSQSTRYDDNPLAKHLVRRDKLTQDKFNDHLIAFIIKTNQSFSVVESDDFKQGWMQGRPEEIKMPNAESLVTLIRKTFEREKEALKTRLDAVQYLGIVLDCWRSSTYANFMGILATYIDDEWKMKTEVLDFAILRGKHTGDSLGETVFEILKDFNILGKVVAITTDNASNNVTMMRYLKAKFKLEKLDASMMDNHVRCVAHIMNISVQNALSVIKKNCADDHHRDYEEYGSDPDDPDSEEESETPVKSSEFDSLYCKLRKLVKQVRASTLLREKLESFCSSQKTKYLQPVLDMKIRWNSTKAMIERALALKEGLDYLCLTNEELKALQLTKNEWSIIAKLHDFLKPFSTATNSLSRINVPLAADGVSSFVFLYQSIAEFENEPEPFRSAYLKAVDKLDAYLPKTATLVQRAGIVLDPRCKLAWYDTVDMAEVKKDSEKLVKKMWKTYFKPKATTAEEEDTSSVGTAMDMVGNFMKKTKVASRDDLDLYLSEGVVKLDGGAEAVLKWWQVNSGRFRELSQFAKAILCVSPTSVPIENKFSGGPDVLTCRRMRMKPETLRYVLCLKSWLKTDPKSKS